jgi:hypothetical protein
LVEFVTPSALPLKAMTLSRFSRVFQVGTL